MKDVDLAGVQNARGVLDKLRLGRRPRPPTLFQPACIHCATKMELASRTPCQARRRRYERHTFACDKCGNTQTYTMGTTEARLAEIWGDK